MARTPSGVLSKVKIIFYNFAPYQGARTIVANNHIATPAVVKESVAVGYLLAVDHSRGQRGSVAEHVELSVYKLHMVWYSDKKVSYLL